MSKPDSAACHCGRPIVPEDGFKVCRMCKFSSCEQCRDEPVTAALTAADLEPYAAMEAEKHRAEEGGGCICGFCAWSVEHVVIMSIRDGWPLAERDRKLANNPVVQQLVALDRLGMLDYTAGPCCWRCLPDYPVMLCCPECGNKRCPRANDHDNACTDSNEPGQPGSAYA